jgi:hypothetical protein
MPKPLLMKTIITLSIPKSCSEKWENFTTTQRGGFCQSCQKTVIDFTMMSDTEVVNYFKTKPAHTCGRFRNNQLKRYEQRSTPMIKPGFGLVRAGLFSLLLIGLSKPTIAQAKPAIGVELVSQQKTIQTKEDKTYTIQGVVTSAEDNTALPGVNIYLKSNLSIGTVSDSEGRFQFPEKLKPGEVIVFTFIGLDTKEYTVPSEATSEVAMKLSISMEMSCYVTLGEVAVAEIYSEPTAFQKFWNKVKSIF